MNSFRLAPEWERQDAILLVWPHPHSDWNGIDEANSLHLIEITYIEMIRYIVRHQKLIVIAYDQNHLEHIQLYMHKHNINSNQIIFILIPTNDTWVRDYGPVCVQSDSELIVLDFEFNAWGQKYPCEKDNNFNKSLLQKLNNTIKTQKIYTVLEAGNIEINNRGDLLSSKACFTRGVKHTTAISDVETELSNWFDSKNILWIDHVQLAGDDTDGHIDNLARFCSDDIIVYSAVGHPSDPNRASLESLSKQLTTIKKNNANRFELIPLPMPDPITNYRTQLPASYANFLITNECVLVPVFNDKRDNSALKVLDDCFPSREIIDIESRTLIQQFGGIHCATMQIPQGLLI